MKYFEGFYIKCSGKKDALAVIFGRQVFNKEKSSFIQIITKDKSYSIAFVNSDNNMFNEKKFEVRVGKNFADTAGLYLDINSSEIIAKGHVAFGNFSKIKYGAMGPLKFLPKMECKHCVVSMKHRLNGQIILNGEIFDFDDGIGYIEGDKGCSFPQKYFWSQCNNESKGVSLFASAARIPYMGIRFMGTICVAHFKGKEYRFASYLGARVKEINAEKLLIKQGRKQLDIELLDKGKGLPLLAPNLGQMTRTIEESLERKVRYKLSVGKNILFDFISDRAVYEYSSI